MEYKVGDKLICKKSTNDDSIFTKGNTYYIKDTDEFAYVYIVKYPKMNYGRWFKLRKNIYYDCSYPFSGLNFYDYFYTLGEIREMKLKKIKNESKI